LPKEKIRSKEKRGRKKGSIQGSPLGSGGIRIEKK
jgi:hypothetical protein